MCSRLSKGRALPSRCALGEGTPPTPGSGQTLTPGVGLFQAQEAVTLLRGRSSIVRRHREVSKTGKALEVEHGRLSLRVAAAPRAGYLDVLWKGFSTPALCLPLLLLPVPCTRVLLPAPPPRAWHTPRGREAEPCTRRGQMLQLRAPQVPPGAAGWEPPASHGLCGAREFTRIRGRRCSCC